MLNRGAILDKIVILLGDITKLEVDAVVNAANTSLLGGGGVDRAIHRAAGKKLLSACRKLNGCETGHAKITKAYSLPAKAIIHTVGPIWSGGHANERELLASCYRQCLSLAKKHQLKTIAFPAISCGVYQFPVEEATQIAIYEIVKFLREENYFDRIFFVCWTTDVYEIYKDELKGIL